MHGAYLNRLSVPDWREGLLTLMYHAVETPPLFRGLRGLYVEPALLARQIDELRATGVNFTALSPWAGQRSDKRAAALTFDDAYCSVFDHALPILTARKLTAIVYVVAGEIGGVNRWDIGRGWQRPLMDRTQLRAWLDAGQEIGAHTLTHCHLTRVPPAQARAEIFDAKKLLEDSTGRPVVHFCYPYGDLDDAIVDWVGEAGYETATTVVPGFATPATPLLRLPRLMALHRRPLQAALRRRLLPSWQETSAVASPA